MAKSASFAALQAASRTNQHVMCWQYKLASDIVALQEEKS